MSEQKPADLLSTPNTTVTTAPGGNGATARPADRAVVPAPAPSIGRIVHYVLDGEAASVGEHRPAIILRVDGDELVSLRVFTLDEDGARYAAGTVARSQVALDEDTRAPGTWHWPERD